MHTNRIRIAIVDDHPVVREGLRMMIEKKEDMRIIAEGDSTERAIEILRQKECDVLLLDLGLPGGGGLFVLEEAQKITTLTKILVLSVQPEEMYESRVLQAGASGYLHKDANPAEIIDAIRMVYRGYKVFKKTGRLENPVSTLTNRQLNILLLVADGKSNSDIAELLQISDKTVHTHIIHILGKLSLSNRAEIIRFSIDNQIMNK